MRKATLAHALSFAVVGFATFAAAIGAFVPGIYRDSMSMRAQAVAQDWVTFAVGVPLLLVATAFSWQGSLRGRLVWLGALGYMLYTYLSYALIAVYNPLFLAYVALFGCSLWAFVLGLAATDPRTVSDALADRPPRRTTAIVVLAIAVLVALLWLSDLVPALLGGTVPRVIAESGVPTPVIQALDFAVVLPVFAATAVLLFRRRPWGDLLASVALVKAATLALAVAAMAVNMARRGIAVSPVELGMFAAIALACAVLAVLFIRAVRQDSPR